MEYIINNDDINHLALTVMCENKIISSLDTSPYNSWVKSGWNFFFVIKNNIVYGVMEAKFADFTSRYEKPANSNIADLVNNYKFM